MNIDIDISNIADVILPKFYPLLHDESRIIIMRGGRSSGKSKFWAQKVIYRILEDFDNVEHRFVVLRQSGANCDRSIVSEIQGVIEEWGLGEIVHLNRTAKTFTFVNKSQILCTGLDDPEKAKSLYKPTGIIFEEATEFTINSFRTVDLSMRGETGSYQQSILCFNPISINNYIYKHFFAGGELDGVKYHLSTFRDNPYIGSDYKDRLEQAVGNNKSLYSVLIEGEWGSVEGLIFNNSDYSIIPKWEEPEGEVIYAMDFGFVDPMVLVKIGKYKDGFIIEELYYQTGCTVDDFIGELPKLDVDNNSYMYCDSANPDKIETIFRAGWNANPCKKGQGSIKAGIDYMLSQKLYITRNSVNLINELQSYSWKQLKDGSYLDEPLDAYNHCIDSCRYGLMTHFANRVDYTITTGA